MTYEKVKNKYLLAVRRPHEVRRSTRNLYHELRKGKGKTQLEMATACGISDQAWRYREHEKEVFRLGELCALRELFGLSWDDMGKLIESCA